MKGHLTLVALFIVSTCFGQDSLLKQTFHKYQKINIDINSILSQFSESKSNQKNIRIDKWDLSLTKSNLLSPNYKFINPRNNFFVEKREQPISLKGITKNGGIASITISKDFIMGFIQDGNDTYYIEPLSHFNKKGTPNTFIIYNTLDIKKTSPIKCGFKSSQRAYMRGKKNISTKRQNNGLCYEIEYFIASDYTMFDKYGLLGLEARNIAILNDVNTNFASDFENEIRLIISGQYVSNCVSCDPWSSSQDFSTLLSSFRNWGNATIGSPGSPLYTSYDIASLWSDRWTSSSVVGQAYLDGVCNSDRYNILSDFSANSNSLRVLVAHEIGHNLNAFHDEAGSGTIMAPSVNITSTWSSSSINAINNTILSKMCFDFCSDLPSTVFWDSPLLNIQELSTTEDEELCDIGFTDYSMSIRISKLPTNDVQVSISSNSGAALLGIDYDLITNNIVFGPSENITKEVLIRIYNDAIVEELEDFELQFDIVSGPAVESSNKVFDVNIISDDELVTSSVSVGDTFFYGEPNQIVSSNGFFEGSRTDVKTRFLISAGRLSNMGLEEGNIDMLSLFIIEKNSTGSFNNFRIGITNTEDDNLNNVPWLSTISVFENDITTYTSWNNFVFSIPYYWNGTSNIYVELCFDNSTIIGEDKIVLFKTQNNQGQLYSYSSNELDNCGSVTSLGWTNDRSPVVLLRQKNVGLVEDYAINSNQTNLKIGEKAVFYSDRNRLIASLENTGNTNLECVQVSIRSEGTGRNSLDIANGRYANKTYRVTPDNEGSYRLTMYYNENEAAVWGQSISDLKCIISDSTLSDAQSEHSEILNFSSYQRIPDIENAHAFTIESTGTKYFGITDWSGPSVISADVKGIIRESGLSLEEIGGGVILNSENNEKYVLKLSYSGSIIFYKNPFIISSSSLEIGDLFIESSTKSLNIATPEYTVVNIYIDDDGNLSRTPFSQPPSQNIKINTGFFELSEPGAGIVFKNSENECYKLYVNAEGVLSTGLVVCP